MPLFLTREFLNDLRASKDGRFVTQVLNHTIGADGSFVSDRDDHRYDGVEDAWIRYVSRGAMAYRVIFIRKGPDIFLHRCGTHSVEDRVKPPSDMGAAIRVAEGQAAEIIPFTRTAAPMQEVRPPCLLKTTEAQFVEGHFRAMYHVRHKEIVLMSPFIDLELLQSNKPLGRFLDRAVEENTVVSVITCTSQTVERLEEFKRLEERGLFVYFLDRLHTKLYLFDVDLTSRNQWQQGTQSQVIIGSSNLTIPGLGLAPGAVNEELNCRLSSEMFDEARTYVERVRRRSDDYKRFAFKLKGRKR